jgi:hypothetical protein
MKFRKKPVVIDAMQFVYTVDGIIELKKFVGLNLGTITRARCPEAKAEAQIITLEDGKDSQVAHIATEGDWIIRGVAGEFYPCKPDIFQQTYEPA